MSVAIAEMIWFVVGVYGALGVVFALAMVLGVMKRFDPLAHAAPLKVKALVFPGLVALWPIVGFLVVTRAWEGKN